MEDSLADAGQLSESDRRLTELLRQINDELVCAEGNNMAAMLNGLILC